MVPALDGVLALPPAALLEAAASSDTTDGVDDELPGTLALIGTTLLIAVASSAVYGLITIDECREEQARLAINDAERATLDRMKVLAQAQRRCVVQREQSFTSLNTFADREQRLELVQRFVVACSQTNAQPDRAEAAWLLVKTGTTAALEDRCDEVEAAAREMRELDPDIANLFQQNSDVRKCRGVSVPATE